MKMKELCTRLPNRKGRVVSTKSVDTNCSTRLNRPLSDEEISSLFHAVLEDALSQIKHSMSRGRFQHCEAWAWLYDDEADGPFSVRTVCAALGLDVENLRTQIGARF